MKTIDGTARKGEDYVPINEIITFEPHQREKQVITAFIENYNYNTFLGVFLVVFTFFKLAIPFVQAHFLLDLCFRMQHKLGGAFTLDDTATY